MPNWKKLIVSGSDASLNSLVVATNVNAQSFTGSLFGTASNAVSSSYAFSASYAVSASHAPSSTTASFAQQALSASFALTASIARNLVIRARNGNNASLSAGTVVHITGAVGDNPIFNTASFDNENLSANTLGVLASTAASGQDVDVVVNGFVVGVNTDPANGYVAGDIIYLSSSGQFTRVQPQAPQQIVTLGQVLRAQQNNGSLYVAISNGWELDELHNVRITSVAYGDLLVNSGSLWVNSKQLSGSYSLTGSLNATSLTASLQGTASWAIKAQTASYADTFTVANNAVISGSLTILQNLNVFGSASITYITQSTLDVATNLITVNTNTPGVRFGGLAVIDSGSVPRVSGSWLFDSVQDRWIFVHQNPGGSAITSSVGIMGPETYNNLGNETQITLNRLTKGYSGVSGEHIGDSQVSDDGTTVSIPGNLTVTGSITGLINSASYAVSSSYAFSSSYALSSSYARNATSASGVAGGTPNYLTVWKTNTALSRSAFYQDPNNNNYIGLFDNAPSYSLDVNGTIRAQGDLRGQVKVYFPGLTDGSPSTQVMIWDSAQGQLFYTGSGGLSVGSASFATSASRAISAATASYTPSITGSANYLAKFTGSSGNTVVNSIVVDYGSNIRVNNVTVGTDSPSNATNNLIFGYGTLPSTTGTYNVAIGDYTLENLSTGNGNVGVGVMSLRNITTGYNNTAIGTDAGRYEPGPGPLITNNSSVFVGNYTRASSNGNTNEIVIGDSAIGNGSNSVTLGNSSITKTILRSNVGVNTTTPEYTLDVNGSGNFGTNLTATGSIKFPSLSNVAQLNVVGYDTATGQLYYQTGSSLSVTSASYAATASSADSFTIRNNFFVPSISDQRVLYKSGSAVTGSSDFIWNYTANQLTINGGSAAGQIQVNPLSADGVYLGAGATITSGEAGLYSANSDQAIALYDPSVNNYYYSNGNYKFNNNVNVHQFTGSVAITQNVTASNALVTGTITAQTLVVQTVTSSIVYSSGSNIFGNQLSDVQQFTGSLRATGSSDNWVVGGNFGFGTTAPAGRIHAIGDVISQTSLNIAGQFWFNSRKSRGTVASPTTVLVGDDAGGILFTGYDGSSWRSGAGIGAQVQSVSAGSLSSNLIFYAGNGSVSSATRVMVMRGDTQNVLVGTTTDPGYKVNVNGSGNFSSNLTATGSILFPSLTNVNQTNVVSYDTTTGQLYYQTTSSLSVLSASYAATASSADSFLVRNTLTASAALISGSGTNRLIVVGSGSAQPIFTVQGSQGELFSITDSLSGSLFSVNNISGLPIFEVFSDNTVLMGNYTAPSLNTTYRTGSSASGSNVIYSLPTASYDGVFMEYTIRSGSNARAGNFMAMWSGSQANYTDTSITSFGSTTGFTFGANVDGGNMIVSGSGTTGGWTVKAIIRAI